MKNELSGTKVSINKEPWLAVFLSTFLAGIGQIYTGRIKRGIILICLHIGLYCSALWFVCSFTGDLKIGVAFFLLLIIIQVWNLFDSYKCAKVLNPENFEVSRRQNKDAWLALFLSDLLPGLGQIYIKKWFVGIVFIVCLIILLIIRQTHQLFLFFCLWAIFSAIACYHAYISTPVKREYSKRLIVIAAAAVFGWELLGYTSILFKEHFVEAFQIHAFKEEFYPKGFPLSGPMEPTLFGGDRILVRKPATYTLARGDIIGFKSPEDPAVPYVMRLIAFEGESVEIKDETVYINAKKIKSPIIQNIKYVSIGKFGLEGEPYIVPKGSVFVLGDNSNNSRDCRFYGAIPKSDIVGKAYKIYWPPTRIGLLY